MALTEYTKAYNEGIDAVCAGNARISPYKCADASDAWYEGYDAITVQQDKIKTVFYSPSYHGPANKQAVEQKQEVYVFWPYDMFPYTLGAVGNMLENGDVYTPSYQGTVSRSRILAIYPVALGMAINEKINALRDSMDREIKSMHSKYAKQLVDVMPEMSKHKSVEEKL